MYEDKRKNKKNKPKIFKYKNIKIDLEINLKNTFLLIAILETLVFFLLILFNINKINYMIIVYIGLSLLGYLYTNDKRMEVSILGIGLSLLLFFSFNIFHILLSLALGFETYVFYKENK